MDGCNGLPNLPNMNQAILAKTIVAYTPTDKSFDSYKKLESLGFNVVINKESIDPLAFLKQINKPEEVFCFVGNTFPSPGLTKEIIEKFENLRTIAKYTIGYDDIDLDCLSNRGVILTNSPTESSWGGVAESTVAMILALLKKVRERHFAVTQNNWRSEDLLGTYLGAREDYEGITLGIIGLGRIGQRVAELFRPWKVKIIACDPYLADEVFLAAGVRRVDLKDLLVQSDVISIHCTLTKETAHLLSHESFQLMKSHSILINTARGKIVDEEALSDALEKNYIASVALDVFEIEPLPWNSKLRKFSNRALFFPHMTAANTPAALSASIQMVTDSVLKIAKGELPDHIVNPEAIKLWQYKYQNQSIF